MFNDDLLVGCVMWHVFLFSQSLNQISQIIRKLSSFILDMLIKKRFIYFHEKHFLHVLECGFFLKITGHLFVCSRKCYPPPPPLKQQSFKWAPGSLFDTRRYLKFWSNIPPLCSIWSPGFVNRLYVYINGVGHFSIYLYLVLFTFVFQLFNTAMKSWIYVSLLFGVCACVREWMAVYFL